MTVIRYQRSVIYSYLPLSSFYSFIIVYHPFILNFYREKKISVSYFSWCRVVVAIVVASGRFTMEPAVAPFLSLFGSLVLSFFRSFVLSFFRSSFLLFFPFRYQMSDAANSNGKFKRKLAASICGCVSCSDALSRSDVLREETVIREGGGPIE